MRWSGVAPRLVMRMKPPATVAPPGVARVHGPTISREPACSCARPPQARRRERRRRDPHADWPAPCACRPERRRTREAAPRRRRKEAFSWSILLYECVSGRIEPGREGRGRGAGRRRVADRPRAPQRKLARRRAMSARRTRRAATGRPQARRRDTWGRIRTRDRQAAAGGAGSVRHSASAPLNPIMRARAEFAAPGCTARPARTMSATRSRASALRVRMSRPNTPPSLAVTRRAQAVPLTPCRSWRRRARPAPPPDGRSARGKGEQDT